MTNSRKNKVYNKFKTKNNNKDKFCTDKNVNLEADYFVAGPIMETARPQVLKQQ